MHKHIKSSGFASFRRQLALYNIKRKRKTNIQPQFSHPLLRKGRIDLLKQIKRLRQTGMKDPDQINIPLLESCRSRLVEKMVNPDGVNLMKFRIMTLDFIKEADRYIGKGIAAFFNKLNILIRNAFPSIKMVISQELNDAETNVCIKDDTNLININRKSSLVKLVNIFLTKLDNMLSSQQHYVEFPLSLEKFIAVDQIFKNIIPEKADTKCDSLVSKEKPSNLFIPKYPEKEKFKNENRVEETRLFDEKNKDLFYTVDK